MPTTTTLIRAAEEHYTSLLARHGDPMIQSFRELSESFKFRHYTLCKVLQPFFLDQAIYDDAMSSAALFFRGLLGILASPASERSAAFAGRPRRRLLLSDAIAKRALLGARVDMLLTASGFKILELNPTTPDYLPFGVECSDPLCSFFAGTPIMREFSERFPCRFIPLQARLFESFVSKHERRGGTGIPNLAIIYMSSRIDAYAGAPASDIPPPDPHYLNLFAYLGGRGLGVQLCGIADLTYDGNVLAANGTRIDVAFIAGDPEYLDFCAPDDPLLRAVQDGSVSTACGYPLGSLLDDKGFLADLTDPLTSSALDPELRAGVSKVVPWTRRVSDVKTTFDGAPVDLLDFIRGNRETLVLKPAIGFGGHGVFLGWEMSQERWLETIVKLPSGYIVQERVVGEKVRLPHLYEGRVTRTELFFDLCPYIWSDGQAEGCLARVSPTPVLNITQNSATMAPVFVLDTPLQSPE